MLSQSPSMGPVRGPLKKIILGGFDIEIDEAPYQVNYGDICGAVIINTKWALTTAHCGRREFIRIGSARRLRGPRIKIKTHITHPEYGVAHEFDYDVQLLELNRPLKFNEKVSAIEISDGEYGDNIYVTGWGYLTEKSDYNDLLQQVDVQMVPFHRCQSVAEVWYNHTLTDRMFCAGGWERDACQGDSGGAAASYGRLVGLSSFGLGCGRGVPGVYVNVSARALRRWIRDHSGT